VAPIRVIRVKDSREIGRRAADEIGDLARRRPECVLALPTGRTPIALYEEMARRAEDGRLDLDQATVFLLDEYVGLSPEDEASNLSFLERHLLDRVAVGTVICPDGRLANTEAEASTYEATIIDAGGLDLAVLGIGGNGHIGLNEPGTPPDSRTRVAALTPSSRRDLAWAFGGRVRDVPKAGYTLGLGTIMEARALLLLATGETKARVLRRALAGPLTERVPASLLRRHPRLLVIVDEAAASLLPPSLETEGA
jgi:glucosamine-6-phosphate deaminase